MLVLTRCDGERVKVGENVWVTVIESQSGRSVIGIDAPGQHIIREELIGTPPKSERTQRPQEDA